MRLALAARRTKNRRETGKLHRACTGGSECLPVRPEDLNASIHPLCEVIAGLQLSCNLLGAHALVLGQVLGVLPLEKLEAILSIRLTPKVAIGSCFLVLGLAQSKRHTKRTPM